MRITFFSMLLLACGTLLAQIPADGIRLNAESGTTYQKIGSCTITEIVVSGQTFTEGLEIAVEDDIDNTWSANVKFPPIEGVESGDVVLVAFYARTIYSLDETGAGGVTVVIERSQPPHTKELYYNISIGQEWKQYYAAVVIANTLSASEVSYLFHCGFPSQIIEIADVQFLNYKNTLTVEELPRTEITYVGQAPDAAWRAPAAERIEEIRKGVVDIVVYDEQGSLAEDANVSIEMLQHQFGFGTAIKAKDFNNDATYRSTILDIFNEVVFENDLKWGRFDPESNNYDLNTAMNTLDNYNIPIRGHNIIWPTFDWMDDEAVALKNDPEALRNHINQRIEDVTQFTKGRLNDWDVINEPYTQHEVQDILGDEVMADWFKRARMNDKDVKLYINDYSIISAGGKNTVHQDAYYEIIEFIEDNGGIIDGIGLQGHMSTELTPITKIYEIVDRFAALDKEIKITEHDIDTDQRGVQADYTRDFMTILFSHASVKSILVWGFWENKHWKPDGAFFNADWTIRPHGEVWIDMIQNQWWTPAIDTLTDPDGEVSLEGFLGTYKYTVESGGVERTGEFTIDNSFASGLPNTLILSLDDTIPDNVLITPSRSPHLCEGEEITLQAPEGSGLTYEWYRNETPRLEVISSINTIEAGIYQVRVKKGAVEIFSPELEVTVTPLPEAATISAAGELIFCEGGSVTLNSDLTSSELNYDWMKDGIRVFGDTTTIEAAEEGVYSLVSMSNGCSSNSLNDIDVSFRSPTDPLCETGTENASMRSTVYPNPFKGSFVLETNTSPGKSRVEMYNMLGEVVYTKELERASENHTIHVSNPGVYVLRIIDQADAQTYKMVGK